MIFHEDIITTFPGLFVVEGDVGPVSIEKNNANLEMLKQTIITEVNERYTLEQVKDEPLFRAYRDFFWSVGVDPTKTRPASEALIRRILAGNRSLLSILPWMHIIWHQSGQVYQLEPLMLISSMGSFRCDLHRKVRNFWG
jgi:DNA/RNA-binding domain of Phe-tRNA-synthetase-like protein